MLHIAHATSSIYATLEPEMRSSQNWSWELAPWCKLAYTWFTHKKTFKSWMRCGNTKLQQTPLRKTKLHFAHFIWSSSWKLWKNRQLRPQMPRCTYVYTHAYIQHACIDPHIHSYVYIFTHMHTCSYTHTHTVHIYTCIAFQKTHTHSEIGSSNVFFCSPSAGGQKP